MDFDIQQQDLYIAVEEYVYSGKEIHDALKEERKFGEKSQYSIRLKTKRKGVQLVFKMEF